MTVAVAVVSFGSVSVTHEVTSRTKSLPVLVALASST